MAKRNTIDGLASQFIPTLPTPAKKEKVWGIRISENTYNLIDGLPEKYKKKLNCEVLDTIARVIDEALFENRKHLYL